MNLEILIKYKCKICSDPSKLGMNLTLLVDKVLQRKRCPFCVAPFPVLKCTSFGCWQCPACEAAFSLDNDGDLEPVFDEKIMQLNDSSVHFPSTQPASSLLCPPCQQNQQKIISVLHAFEGTARQYHDQVKRIEAKYPLCATCSYRVSQKLEQSQEGALQFQRQHAFTSTQGRDWRSKIKLAEQMKGKQLQRKLLKGTFFVPEFLFQGALIFAIFKGPFTDVSSDCVVFDFSLADGKSILLWLPRAEHISVGPWFFVVCAALLLWQVLGAGWNGRGLSSVIIQVLAFSLRAMVANFLFNADVSGVSKLTAAVIASTGLAIVVRTGSSNGQVRAQRALKLEVIRSRNLENPQRFESSTLLGSVPSSSTGGFARFSNEEHKYHSFANQVSGEVKPWPVKPKPGKFQILPKTPDFASLAASSANGSSMRMRPSRLVVNDPLEVESLFSSFSLSDSPINCKEEPRQPKDTKEASSFRTTKPPVKGSQFWFFVYNVALSLALIVCRVLVGTHLSMISVVLAANFGLRGFIWPRLSTPQQAAVMTLSLLRLLHLTLELSQPFNLRIPVPVQLLFDVILILAR